MISAIFACDSAGGFGFNHKLPWPRVDNDMRFFSSKTKNQITVMGRGTWESSGMPKPLPDRVNVVVSVSGEFPEADATLRTVDEIRSLPEKFPGKEIFIIGGAGLLSSTLHLIDRIFFTEIFGEYPADRRIDPSGMLHGFDLVWYRIYPGQCKMNEFRRQYAQN